MAELSTKLCAFAVAWLPAMTTTTLLLALLVLAASLAGVSAKACTIDHDCATEEREIFCVNTVCKACQPAAGDRDCEPGHFCAAADYIGETDTVAAGYTKFEQGDCVAFADDQPRFGEVCSPSAQVDTFEDHKLFCGVVGIDSVAETATTYWSGACIDHVCYECADIGSAGGLDARNGNKRCSAHGVAGAGGSMTTYYQTGAVQDLHQNISAQLMVVLMVTVIAAFGMQVGTMMYRRFRK